MTPIDAEPDERNDPTMTTIETEKAVQDAMSCPLSFSQQRLWFLEKLAPGTSVYNIPLACRLKGPLSVAALERSFGEIVRRHEILRTSFGELNGEPTQFVASSLVPRIEFV